MADLSPAEVLRAAATLMRERAGKATPGRWYAFSSTDEQAWYVGSRSHGQVTTGMHEEPGVPEILMIERDRRDAEFIASMGPDVALPLADWLEQAAAEAEAFVHRSGGCDRCDGWFGDEGNTEADAVCHCWDKALAVARAYLGSEQQ